MKLDFIHVHNIGWLYSKILLDAVKLIGVIHSENCMLKRL